MRINLIGDNPALKSIFRNSNQIITMDANFLIPPDRSRIVGTSISFSMFQSIWLEPIFSAFPNLAIHESVYKELVSPLIKSYVQKKLNDIPPSLVIYKDSTLSGVEKVLRDTIEGKIYPLTKYDPLLDNKNDRGEVKSLAYIAVKGLTYFATYDFNTIQLVEKAEAWSTGLDNVRIIRAYEIIYYLYIMNFGDSKMLRALYKYLYHLTKREKEINPNWSKFIDGMKCLYRDYG